MTLEILTPILATIGGFLGAFLTSYLQTKAKNYATKSDIEKITNKVEGVKQSYSESLEVFKSNVKTTEELRSPIIERNKKIDDGLIEKFYSLNLLLFKVSQKKEYHLFDEFLEKLPSLTDYLVAYRLRYGKMDGVENMVKLHNHFKYLADNPNEIDLDKLKYKFQELYKTTELILSNFILPFEEQNTNEN